MSFKQFVSNIFKSNNLYRKWERYSKSKNLIVNKINVQPNQRQSQDIGKWKLAIQSAEGFSQSRVLLYDLYKDILLDGFLKRVIGKRISAITNKELTFTIKGKEIDDVVNLTDKEFFADLLCEIMNTKFYGHSLIELDWAAPKSGDKSQTVLIPRKHVKPRFGIVTQEQYGTDGIQYRDDKLMSRIIEVGKDEDLGDILEACQYVIYKRGGFGDWAEFAEIFGMPFRWATYDNENTRQVLETAMEQAGSAGYVVAPTDAKLEFMKSDTQNGTDVFDKLRRACNEELAILILGNTMTTSEAKNSGYAQSKTHSDGQDELHKDDRKFVLRVLNEKLNPILERLGYRVKGGKWNFKEEETTSLKDKMEIALQVSSKVPVGASYWYETFKIPVPTADDLPVEPVGEKGEDEGEQGKGNTPQPPKGGEKKKLSDNRQFIRRNALMNLHDVENCNHVNLMDEDKFPIRFAKIDEKIESDFLEKLYRKKIKASDLHSGLFKNFYIRLIQFAEAGFSDSMYKPKDLEQLKMFESFKRNLSNFAAHKNQMLSQELSGLAKLPFKDYLKEGRKLVKRYNQNYLKAELSVINASADSAARWRNHLASREYFPNLTYFTANDERVRGTHQQMNGKVFAIDDPIWDLWMPPNGYRCRCLTVATDEDVNNTPVTIEPDKGFLHNSGKTLKVFDDSHPYFDIAPKVGNKINKDAEKLRSTFEEKELLNNAITNLVGAKLSLPNHSSKLTIGKSELEQVIKSNHQRSATRNGLLPALKDILPQLQFISKSGKNYIYKYEFLGDDYYFKFALRSNGFILISIKDTI